MLAISPLDSNAEVPLFRQLYEQVKEKIESGALRRGARLPATRELAGQLGLNRTTISAAYELLESEGLIAGHVGRGSFVTGRAKRVPDASAPASFSRSRPSELLFPLAEFRLTCAEVIASEEAASILQLGSPSGYAPLRRCLLEQAREEGTARESDDILITSGCQQAFDLLQRVVGTGTVLIEDPVYLGVRRVFERAGARLIGVPVGAQGIDLEQLEQIITRERPRLLCITPNFQNPTGATLPLAARQALLRITQPAGVTIIENDIYSPLCYEGQPLPSLKQLDEAGDTVLLRSFSKVAFPGLRVGWVIARPRLIEKLTEAKQWSDLHTDQLSQAVLLRFAESGRLERHREHMLLAGRARLEAVLEACEKYLPAGARYTRPRGGMNLWIELPESLDAADLLPRAEREGVTYLPGRYFAVSRPQPNALRISFAGMTPQEIRSGLETLGRIFADALDHAHPNASLSEVAALV